MQLLLRLGKAQIKGLYSVSVPSSTNETHEEFEINLYSELIYSHNVPFKIEDTKVFFEKGVDPRLGFDKVKTKYANPPSAVKVNLENYLNSELLEAVASKIHEEIQQKVSLDSISTQIKKEYAIRYRNELAARLKKAITDSFADVPVNAFNVLYHDVTNFKVSMADRRLRTNPKILITKK